MKILKIFGLVVGIHVLALIFIFASPGCSATTRPAPTPADTVARNDASASLNVPMTPPVDTAPPASVPAPASSTTFSTPVSPAPSFTPAPSFDPNAAAVSPDASGAIGLRVTPTRPNTPVANAIVAEPVTDVVPATTYTVTSGDNLWNLAKKHHLSVAELAAANGLKTSTVLHPGQKLVIPGKSGATTSSTPAKAPAAKSGGAGAALPARSASGEVMKHVVQPGETLSGIAKKYEVRSGDIAVANNITDPIRQVKPGLELTIPGWIPGSKAGKAAGKSAGDATRRSSSSTTAAPASTPSPSSPIASPASDPNAVRPPMLDVPVNRVEDSPFTPAPKK